MSLSKEYDVYYTTGGLHFVGGGSDIWVNDWIELISKRLDVTPVLCIDRIKIGHDSKEWYEAFYKEKFGHLKIVEVNNESDFDEVADLYVIWARAEIKDLDEGLMSANRKYSYWIIGSLLFIIILTVIPWEDTLPSGPKVGVVELDIPISGSKQAVKDLNYFNDHREDRNHYVSTFVRLETLF